jgi:hypothetical protein
MPRAALINSQWTASVLADFHFRSRWLVGGVVADPIQER